MKRLFYFLLLPLLLTGCRDMGTELDDIKARLITLEGTTVSSIDEQITAVKASIKALQDAKSALEGRDTELGGMIDRLQSYVDNTLSKEEDWVKATYCTLEQYQHLSDEVAALKAGLGPEVDGKLSALEASLKSWVGTALTGYYDIATMDAKLSALATVSSVEKDITEVKAAISKAKEELTAAYKDAISEAITTNNGVIDGKIAREIGTVQTRIDGEVSALNEKIAGLEKRVKALEDLVAGLRVSDSIFGFVNYSQADTITKGLPYLAVFRLNPSGILFTKDMAVLDNMSSKKFLYTPETETETDPVMGTRASYITESKNYVPDSLGKSRNKANEEMDGQYFLRLKSTETRNLIDDNLFTLVGAYRDKEEKVQYVSSTPFQLVMMPTPEEGLTNWGFARGNVTHASLKSVQLPTQEGEEAKFAEVWTQTLGDICYSFDRRTYTDEEDNHNTRTYSCKNLRYFTFEGNSKKDSIVIFEPHRDSCYVRFLPDTSKAEWRALMDTTKHATLKVSGKIHAFDRYGGSSSFPVEMTWYSRHTDTLSLDLKVADFYEADGKRKAIEVDLEEILAKRGFFLSEVQALRRNRHVRNAASGPGSLIQCSFVPGSETKVKINTYAPKDKLPGTHKALAVESVVTFPSEKSELKECQALECPILLKVNITE